MIEKFMKQAVRQLRSRMTDTQIAMAALLIVEVLVFGLSARGAEIRHLKTNFDFEDQIVKGRYQYPDEATTTVENEKVLKDLLEVRKDFKDRMKLEASRH